jgi:two-component system cell cycle sensor histidine kinase/response regulator CckA
VLHKHPDTRLDLLVTDVVMPQMGGRELAERLRQDRPGLKVLFTTGYSSEAESISRILSPSTFYLAKPFNASGLGRKVREVLDA